MPALIAGFAMAAVAQTAPAPPSPNIVFVLADDLDRAITTVQPPVMPNLTRLIGAAGATFSRAYVNVPLCGPSRATILTGRYAHNTGMIQNWYPYFTRANGERSTIAVWLAAAGYRTALFGKYLNRYPESVTPTYVPPGWTDWAVPVSGDPNASYVLNENGTLVSYVNGGSSDYFTDVLARKALALIDQAADASQPFFLMLTPTAPHKPAVPATRHASLFADSTTPRTSSFNERDVRDKARFLQLPVISEARIAQMDELYRNRLRSLQAVDEAILAIHDKVEQRGLLASTYFVFTSDNGYHMGQHRLTDSINGGKETDFEEDIRLPMMISGPSIPAGLTVGRLASLADLAPTFAAWASAVPDITIDGRSLVPVLGTAPPATWRNWLPIRHWKPSGITASNPAQSFIGVRTARYTYARYPEFAIRDLYDMSVDAAQRDNVAYKAPAALLSRLDSMATSLAGCAGEVCRSLENAAGP
ncbi:MAG: sulfatase [Geminicoccaceae bacterium]